LAVYATLAGGAIMFSVCGFVCSILCCQTFECEIFKTNKPILMLIDTSGPRGKVMKRSNLGVRRSKVKGQGHTRPKIDMEAWWRMKTFLSAKY